jgi:hypothetical protein
MAETDPPRRPTTMIWWMLGAAVIVVFVAIVFSLGGHLQPRAVGPPLGSP